MRDRTEYNKNIISLSNKEIHDRIEKIFNNTSRDVYLTRADIIREIMLCGLLEVENKLKDIIK